MCSLEAPMRDDPRDEILNGVKAYLREHFPDTEITERTDPSTRSVMLHGSGPTSFRLEVTQQFLDGEEGAAIPLNWIRDWNLAGTLRDSGNRIVRLKTSGVSVA
jgi:hypothetical protein